MQFPEPPRRRTDASLLPMINVVFLLLIFFLISARMLPPEPFAVTPPEAMAEDRAEALGKFTLALSGGGRLGYRDLEADAALAALAAARDDHCAQEDCTAHPPRLTLRADAGLAVSDLSAVLRRLGGLGFAEVDLAVRAPQGAP